jgi:hypothetical protein
MESPYLAISRLVFSYAERLDAGDLVGMAALFAAATLRTVTSEGIAIFRGPDEVLAAFASSVQMFEDGTPSTKHVTTNLVVDVDEPAGCASGRAYFTVFQARPDFALQPVVAGRYEDSFACPDGRWRFTDRLIRIDLFGDVRHHIRDTARAEIKAEPARSRRAGG